MTRRDVACGVCVCVRACVRLLCVLRYILFSICRFWHLLTTRSEIGIGDKPLVDRPVGGCFAIVIERGVSFSSLFVLGGGGRGGGASGGGSTRVLHALAVRPLTTCPRLDGALALNRSMEDSMKLGTNARSTCVCLKRVFAFRGFDVFEDKTLDVCVRLGGGELRVLLL